MTDGAPLTNSEIGELRRLLEIEKIRTLRTTYAHMLDSRDFDAAAEMLTEDAVNDFGMLGAWHGRDRILAEWKSLYSGSTPYSGLHVATNLWMELTGPDSAVSRGYIHSVHNQVDARTTPTALFAVNDHEYRKRDGRWLISCSRLHVLWPKRMAVEKLLAQCAPMQWALP